MTTFADLGVAQKFLDALDAKGYTIPTPIQEQAIPFILEGKDVFGCAQTGTGKTAAFSLPTLQRLDATHDDSVSTKGKPVWIRSVILTPTRELAIQIGENLRMYGKKSNLRSTVIYGGVSQAPQVKVLRKGVEIVVATPGRLLDLINQKHVNLTHVEILILDEADRMLDMGFINDIKKITNHIPKKRQTLFFSATMASSIMNLANTFLQDPVRIEIAPESSTVDTVTQALYTVQKDDKKNLLLYLLKDKDIKNAVVFTKTKHGANKVEKILSQAGIASLAIHGNKSQSARQRALSSLKDGSIRVLVATDVAARGIDVNELSHVIIYDVPLEPEVYVHRIGRTGRAGLEGDAIMFFEPEEMKYYKQIIKLIGQDVPLVKDHPFHLDIDMNRKYPTTKSSERRGSSQGRFRGSSDRSRGKRGGEKSTKPEARGESSSREKKRGDDVPKERKERRKKDYDKKPGYTAGAKTSESKKRPGDTGGKKKVWGKRK